MIGIHANGIKDGWSCRREHQGRKTNGLLLRDKRIYPLVDRQSVGGDED